MYPTLEMAKTCLKRTFSRTKTTFSGWCSASGNLLGGLGLLSAKYHHSDPSHITTSGQQKFPRAASTAAEESERGPPRGVTRRASEPATEVLKDPRVPCPNFL